MPFGVVADRRLRTRTPHHNLLKTSFILFLKTFIGFFAIVEPILGVLG
jgi:hypothetical protein